VLLEVGRIVRPHGLKGEVVVDMVSDRPERMAPGSVLQAAAGALEVAAARPHQGRWVVTFVGVSGRDAAEGLRDQVLRAAPLDDPDVLWVHDLVGAEVVDVGGASLGRVVAVEANPASDLLVLDAGPLIPLRFVTASEPGRLTVELPEGLLDLG
jgi:16S rRNA processing protein RimM